MATEKTKQKKPAGTKPAWKRPNGKKTYKGKAREGKVLAGKKLKKRLKEKDRRRKDLAPWKRDLVYLELLSTHIPSSPLTLTPPEPHPVSTFSKLLLASSGVSKRKLSS